MKKYMGLEPNQDLGTSKPELDGSKLELNQYLTQFNLFLN